MHAARMEINPGEITVIQPIRFREDFDECEGRFREGSLPLRVEMPRVGNPVVTKSPVSDEVPAKTSQGPMRDAAQIRRGKIVLGLLAQTIEDWKDDCRLGRASQTPASAAKLTWLEEFFLPLAEAQLITGRRLATADAIIVVGQLFRESGTRLLAANLNNLLLEIDPGI